MLNQKPLPGDLFDYGCSLSDSLAGLWLSNQDSGGQVIDLSGNNNTGTFVNHTAWTAGKFGSSALIFDGTDDYVQLDNDLFAFQNFSVSAWIYIKGDGVGSILGIYSNTAGDNPGHGLFYLEGGDNVGFYVYDTAWRSAATGTLLNDTWYHIVGVADSGSLRIYVNGVLGPTTGSYTTIDYSGTNLVRIGSYGAAAPHYFNGIVDHLGIWNRALSASEAALLYREPFCMFGRRRRRIGALGEVAAVAGLGMPIVMHHRKMIEAA